MIAARCVLGPGAGEEIDEQVTQSNLAQHIGKDPIRLARSRGRKEDADQNEQEAPPYGVEEPQEDWLSHRLASAERQRKSDSDHEHECRLNQVPEGDSHESEAAIPIRMRELGQECLEQIAIQRFPNRGICRQLRESGDPESTGGQHCHDEATVGIERRQSSIGRPRIGCRNATGI